MYDHLNSGIRNGGLEGPGLNIGLPFESWATLGLLISKKNTKML